MLGEIRDHIKQTIRQCSKKYCEIDNPFFREEDLIQSKLDYQYSITIGASSPVIGEEGLGSVDLIPVNLKLFRQGGRDKLTTLFDGYDHALLIRDLLLDRAALIDKEYVKGITSSNVTPAEVGNSQDIYSYEINLNVTISYGIGE